MFCTKCGSNLKDGALFCTNCGAKIAAPQNAINPVEEKPEIKAASPALVKKEKKKHPILKGILIFWIVMMLISVLVVGGVLLLEISGKMDFKYTFGGKEITQDEGSEDDSSDDDEKEDDDDKKDEDVLEEDKKDEDIEDETIEEIEEKAEEEILEIRSSNDANYSASQVLDYTKYNTYDSGIGEFAFSYPGALFNSEYFTDEETDGCYGTVLQEIHYSGSDGSFVNFTLSSRYDNRTYEGMADYVHNHEESFISSPEDVLYSVAKDKCEIIITGYTTDEESAIVYNLTKVDRRYVYQMKIYYPTPENGEDELHKNYYVETMYRMCKFAESSERPRLYEDFYEENY